jgi:diguanylate cyclase (GGDEF)-like protein
MPDSAIPFVVAEGEVDRLERQLGVLAGVDRLPVLVSLAWQLRQRDGRRAAALAQEARAMLPLPGDRDAGQRRQALRLALAEAEVHWQFVEYDDARRLADESVLEAALLGDTVAGADAHWILATLANDLGDMPLRDASFAACEAHAEAAGDDRRATIAKAAMARWAVFSNMQVAHDRWGALFGDGTDPWPEGVLTWVLDFLGNMAFFAGDYSRATLLRLRMHEDAIATGQRHRAIVALTNIGGCFSNLNDHETGLAWIQRGLDEARRLGWPAATAGAMLQVGGILPMIGHFDAARDMLLEARSMPGVPPVSRNMALALQYLGEVYNELHEYERAIEVMQELEGLAAALQQSDMLLEARLARGVAIAALGRLDEGIALVEETLVVSREHRRRSIEIDVLMELARLYARRRDQPDAVAQDGGRPVQCLREALEVAHAIEGYQVSGDLYDALAAEHAHAGDFRAAYEVSRQAAQARERTVSAAALSRSVAMQIGFQTERARAEAEHHRSLAATLQQTTATLEVLGAIGQEITRHLDETAIFEVLRKHVNDLLDATHFSVYLLDEADQVLLRAFGVERDQPIVGRGAIPVSSPQSNVARCARTREEIVRHEAVAGPNPNHIPGTLPSSSALFSPLAIGDRLLGVMTIQSPHAHAYAERERLIFRTLCAYGAIGLDNARAYRRLGGTLDELHAARDELSRKNELLEHAYRQQQEASLTDPLTQLRNRRFLMERIEDEVALTLRRQDRRQRRGDAPAGAPEDRDLAFFMIDIDQFKSINDRHGHAAGDAVLVQVAQRLREVARETDYVIRWGGEEFLIVARATHADEGAGLAERLRHAISSRPFNIGEGRTIERTCSIGFAGYPFHRDHPRLATWSEITGLADQALYRAKEEGRNRWVGFYATKVPSTREGFERLCRDVAGAAGRGEITIVRGP